MSLKKEFKRVCLLGALTVCCTIAATASTNKTILSIKEREAAKLERQQIYQAERDAGRRDRLKAEYGFTDDEVDKFIEMRDAQKAKVNSISSSTTLSKEAKKVAIEKAVSDYHELVKGVLTASQYTIYQAKILAAQEQAMKERKIDLLIKSCRKELSQMNNVQQEMRDQKREEIIDKYVSELSQYLDFEVAKKRVMNLYYERIAISNGANKENLSNAELAAAGRVISMNKNIRDSLKTIDMWQKTKDQKRKRIYERQDEKIAILIEDQNAASNIAARDERVHKQLYAEDYGLTNEQYAKLIAIENKYAVERMAVMKSAIPQSEKATAVKKLYWQKIAQLKKLVPDDQQEAWLKKYRTYNKPKTVKITKNN